ncbi:MAG: quinolinate synthase NadA [Thaumarchaeota archaeon]|nr:quinolinate synthase NadA [Nitrososphaerota archaeon]
MEGNSLKNEILRLKKDKDAVILAHNYQIPEVQDVADFVGDSLGLSQQAAKTNAKIIIFCGVHFMAETASIICPDKKVLIPDTEAGCSLSDTINAEQLRKWKEENPNAVVVGYVNTTADVKAMCDYCCTSSNAVKVVNSISADRTVLFLPDMFLGAYVAEVTKRKNMLIWPGECHVHAGIRPEMVNDMLNTHKRTEFLIHPECGCTTSMMYYFGDNNGKDNENSHNVKFFSTEGMMKHVKNSNENKFVIATEIGILYRMQKENPKKKFIPISENAICKYMKMITLDKVLRSLTDMIYEVKVHKSTAAKAKLAIERMLTIN